MFLEFWVQAARNPEIEKLVIAPYRRYPPVLCADHPAGDGPG